MIVETHAKVPDSDPAPPSAEEEVQSFIPDGKVDHTPPRTGDDVSTGDNRRDDEVLRLTTGENSCSTPPPAEQAEEGEEEQPRLSAMNPDSSEMNPESALGNGVEAEVYGFGDLVSNDAAVPPAGKIEAGQWSSVLSAESVGVDEQARSLASARLYTRDKSGGAKGGAAGVSKNSDVESPPVIGWPVNYYAKGHSQSGKKAEYGGTTGKSGKSGKRKKGGGKKGKCPPPSNWGVPAYDLQLAQMEKQMNTMKCAEFHRLTLLPIGASSSFSAPLPPACPLPAKNLLEGDSSKLKNRPGHVDLVAERSDTIYFRGISAKVMTDERVVEVLGLIEK